MRWRKRQIDAASGLATLNLDGVDELTGSIERMLNRPADRAPAGTTSLLYRNVRQNHHPT